jgi:drug/metabolite transporter (DMT)-like permease
MNRLNAPNLCLEFALLALLACLWGSSYLLIKVALTSILPVTLMAIRVTAAELFLVIVMPRRRERLPSDVASWKELFVQSLLNSSLAWVVLAWGQQYVPSGTAGVLNSTSPLFVFFAHDGRVARLRRRCVGGGHRCLARSRPTNACANRRAVRRISLRLCGAQRQALGASLAVGHRHWHHAVGCDHPDSVDFLLEKPMSISPSISSLAATFTLAIACTSVALIIYFRLIKTLGAMGVTSQSYLRAGVSVLLGLFVLGESLSLSVLIGLTTTIAGVALISRPTRGASAAHATQPAQP